MAGEPKRDKRDKRSDKLSDRELQRLPRLDTPQEIRRRLIRSPFHYDSDTFGVFAERFARFMGTAKFLIYMTVFVALWVTLNVVGFVHHWDKYPFILLNLFFSTQASYAAPLILLAQNRQEDRDRIIAEQDRRADASAHADMEFLAREVAALRMAMGEVATRDYIRSELRSLLADLDERAAGEGAEDGEDAGDDPDHAPARPVSP